MNGYMSHVAHVNESPAHFAVSISEYGVATISRLHKIVSLFCKRAL